MFPFFTSTGGTGYHTSFDMCRIVRYATGYHAPVPVAYPVSQSRIPTHLTASIPASQIDLPDATRENTNPGARTDMKAAFNNGSMLKSVVNATVMR